MNLPISLLVFDETKSTFLSALIMICGMLPDIILPVIIAPFIDRGNKKIWIISLDIFMVFIYAGMGFWTLNHRFNYILYIVFVLVVATNSIIYQLAYSSWYPDLIEKGFLFLSDHAFGFLDFLEDCEMPVGEIGVDVRQLVEFRGCGLIGHGHFLTVFSGRDAVKLLVNSKTSCRRYSGQPACRR